MRRGSLVGPLLIILIGVWFLISSVRPDLPLLDIAARFWPYVLIGWGALRLVEIWMWAGRGRAVPAAGISGGEWTAIVFICLLGSGLFAMNRYRPWQHFPVFANNRVEIFGHSYDYAVPEQKAPAPKGVRVLVENLRGNARIVGGDIDEVRVGGHKTVRSLQENDAERANQQSPVELSTQGEQVVIRTNQDRVTGDQRVSTDLDITVPRAAGIEIRSRYGDLEISDLNGPVEVSSDNAGVRLQNIGANVRLDLRKSDLVRASNVKGNVELTGGHGRDLELENIGGEVMINGSYSGDLQMSGLGKALRVQSPQTELRVEKVPGQIHMDLGEFSGSNLVGPIRLTSNRSRDVRMEQFTNALELSLERGDITLRPVQPPAGKIDARTHTGEIELALPASAKFELKAVTNRGELNNEFGPVLKTEFDNEERRTGGTIVGSVGQGPVITLATDRGSITIRKDTGAPAAPRPPKERVEISVGDKPALTVESH